ncbi:RNA chaperone ProQ [Colwellia sp. 4_MG-2023]|jgi:ProP effector|uniref:RNA chaperone ProQ n=1 Tax=unclassified Colwellia TaxID=196834 RepID=UPI001C08E98F|nr:MULTISPECIES: RNA chaperone ProQ [unclassified Colwellia]MBU2923409.1 RNA chaperone ProQ [Colwellia sp. C2M11]MDO6508034.1 RNA chaperone ProQ [Colwellia sp. 5_MG-2023]MDO6556785.1 RNA chaperone ProQ [Colwellia sp. 4_MG-2023]MDO6653769.1 RNA chaperone ProQ [Colwellia sp. 3_MG-2023]MDO6666601.1 RNA chaperone ProQ [Colwellia sp. 2_MG-2023]
METEIKRISTKDIITYLTEKFPECFSVKGPVKPLKVGIFQDLAEKLSDDETVSKTRLRQALRHYTSSWRYLKAIKTGAFRVDIDGKDVAEIDEEQANYASKTLKESQEKFGKTPASNKKAQGDKRAPKANTSKSNDKSSDETKRDSAKFKSVKSTKRKDVKKELPPLKKVDSATIKVGNKVKVQLGNSPMNATITEIAGKDISVQLDSGMTIKTQMQNIYS